MNAPTPAGRWIDALWLVTVGVLSSAWCLTAAPRLSATFDEPFYVQSGLTAWRTGTTKPLMSAGTMPLPIDVHSLPLYLWERAEGVTFDPMTDLTRLLPVARAANLVFWWLLLVYAMRLGRTFGGPWAGRIACGLIAADPNFLAHAALATTDIAVTATTLMAVFHFHAGRGLGWKWRVLVPGLCYGLAVLSKASAMAFVPMSFVVLGLHRHFTQTAEQRQNEGLRALVRDLVGVIAVGSVLVFTYCGSDWTTERTFVEWAHGLSDGSLKNVMVPVSENLRIFTNAGEGLFQQVKHNFRGHGAYLHGDWHPRACWYYFPYALAVKLPLATLALLALAAVRWRAWFANPVGWLAAAYLLFSLTCRVQIGIRLVFPLVATLLIAAAVTLTTGYRGRWPRILAGGAIAINAVLAASVWPHGLCFVNRLHGGPTEGFRSLSDSNYDWGQGLPDLLPFTGDGQPPLAVWYYGTDQAINRPPFRHLPLHVLPTPPNNDYRLFAPDARLAVGVSLLYGDPNLTPTSRAAVEYLKKQTPVARTPTFFIYDLRPTAVAGRRP